MICEKLLVVQHVSLITRAQSPCTFSSIRKHWDILKDLWPKVNRFQEFIYWIEVFNFNIQLHENWFLSKNQRYPISVIFSYFQLVLIIFGLVWILMKRRCFYFMIPDGISCNFVIAMVKLQSVHLIICLKTGLISHCWAYSHLGCGIT